jgi:hypothetical protein
MDSKEPSKEPSKKQLDTKAINEMYETQDFGRFGVADPKRNCKKCYGRGYIGQTMAPLKKGVMARGKIPLPCDCMLSYPSKLNGPVQFKPKENSDAPNQ